MQRSWFGDSRFVVDRTGVASCLAADLPLTVDKGSSEVVVRSGDQTVVQIRLPGCADFPPLLQRLEDSRGRHKFRGIIHLVLVSMPTTTLCCTPACGWPSAT